MAINSKQKGSRGERALCKRLAELGVGARRTQQYCGADGTADVKLAESADYHIECKVGKRIDVEAAVEQAERDNAASAALPVVCHKRDRSRWLATMTLETLVCLMKRAKPSEN